MKYFDITEISFDEDEYKAIEKVADILEELIFKTEEEESQIVAVNNYTCEYRSQEINAAHALLVDLLQAEKVYLEKEPV